MGGLSRGCSIDCSRRREEADLGGVKSASSRRRLREGSGGEAAALDVHQAPCDVAHAWRRISKSRRQANCSTGFSQLPPCNPLHDEWSRAAHCRVPALTRQRTPFSSRYCKNYFRNEQLLLLLN